MNSHADMYPDTDPLKHPAAGRCCPQFRSKRRRIVRCGVPALDFGDVEVAGELVEIALCRAHFRTLRDSQDPHALKAFWSPDPPRP
jgi:hypothetical protein